MTVVVEGHYLGAGKTLALAFLIWHNWLRKHQKIYSNFHLFKIPYIYITGINHLDSMRNGFVALDEFWSIVDARASTTKKNKIVSDILLKSRKRGLQYVFTAQILDLLDKRIRKVQDFTGYPYMNRTETATKLLIFRSGYPKEEHLLRTFYFKNPLVFDLYNTNEEILMEEKSEKESMIVFQENYNEEHGYWCRCADCGTVFFDNWEDAEAYGLAYWNENYKTLLPLIM